MITTNFIIYLVQQKIIICLYEDVKAVRNRIFVLYSVGSVWVRNLVSNIKVGTLNEGV
jgi:hypothetical protein